MPGFPPADRLYYENPSYRIAGAIVKELAVPPRGELRISPDAPSLFGGLSSEHHESLAGARDALSATDTGTKFYRGQTGRYAATYSGTIQRLRRAETVDTDRLTVTFESLIPSRYRDELGTDEPDWNEYEAHTFIDQVAPAVRAIMSSEHRPLRELLFQYLHEVATNPDFLLRRLSQKEGLVRTPAPEDLTAEDTTIQKSLLKLISVSQHYGFGSTMTDVTKSVDVATWFASHRWSGAVADEGGTGVIYEFETDGINPLLRREIRNESPVGEEIFATRFTCHVDISDMDEVGKRPTTQAGGSILGLENSIVYYLFLFHDLLTVHTFPLDTVTGTETPVDRGDIRPDDDPLVDVFDDPAEYSAGPVTNAEYESFLTEEGMDEELKSRVLRANDQYNLL